MTEDKWILDGHTPVKADLMTWAMWFEKADRVVAKTEKDHVTVSTVFLGLDHSFGGDGPPLIFETMIFGGSKDGWQERCSTWDEAVAMHHNACAVAFPKDYAK